MSVLAKKLQGLMREHGVVDNRQFASQVGLHHSLIDSILSGKAPRLGDKILKKIASFFDVSFEDLLLDEPLPATYIPEKERYYDAPCEVLNYLMKDVGDISECELSRRTGVPQPTIHRILTGKTSKPRKESLEPLAKFFMVSVDQILARVPLPYDRISGSFASTEILHKTVPLLTWEEVKQWPEILKSDQFKSQREWVTSESGVRGESFALRVESDAFLPEFRVGATIVLDCQRQPKSGSFVLGKLLDGDEVTLGYFLQANKGDMFVSLENDSVVLKIAKDIIICAVVSEVKYIF